MTKPKMKFTDSLVKQLRPRLREYTLWDARFIGLGVRVRPSGHKTWILRHEGIKKSLGEVNALPVSMARQQAQEVLYETPRSVDAETPRLEDFITGAWMHHRQSKWKPIKRPNSGASYYINKRILPEFGDMAIGHITHQHILEWFVAYSKTSPGAATRALATLKSILSLAVELELLATNPAQGIKPNPAKRIDRFLSSSEIKRLYNALRVLERESPKRAQAADIIRLLLLTGARCGEIQTLQWDFVQEDKICLPDSKTGARDIYLSHPARDIIEKQRDAGYSPAWNGAARGASIFDRASKHQRDTQKWVFPLLDDPRRAIVSVYSFWVAVKTHAKLEDVRLHDLRHTYASHAVMEGAALPIVSRLLGHSSPRMSLRYIHVDDTHILHAAETIGTEIETLFEGKRK